MSIFAGEPGSAGWFISLFVTQPTISELEHTVGLLNNKQDDIIVICTQRLVYVSTVWTFV